MFSWIAEYGFTLLQSVGIIGSLLFTGWQLNLDTRARRVENRLKITRSHREIWREFARDPDLSRVLDEEVDLEAEPVTQRERLFVTEVILHLNAAFTAYREGMAAVPDGMAKDVQALFEKPIPKVVWKESKVLRDGDLVDFVESESCHSRQYRCGSPS